MLRKSFFPALVILALVCATSGSASGSAATPSIRLPRGPALGVPAAPPRSLAPTATCTVTTPADSGDGSLRDCLEKASLGNTITFDPAVFPPATPVTIFVTNGQLPDLDDGNVTIDATGAGVILDGSGLSGGEHGLRLTSGGNQVIGLQIQYFPGDGVNICCGAQYNVVGGNTEAERNLIVANGANGVAIQDSGTSHNVVQGNQIGFGPDMPQQAFPADQAISPNFASDHTLYAATLIRGVMKSTDAGATWTEANNGLGDTRLMQIEIPPGATDANTVFVLAQDGDLYRTDDGGANWSLVSSALGKLDRRNIAFSATFGTDHTIYAAAEGWAWQELGGQPGVFKSTNEGVDWIWISGGMASNNVRHIYASPDSRAAGVFFALTGAGIERSRDSGASWETLSFPETDLRGLAISPDFDDDKTLFVATGGQKIYKGTHAGNDWTYSTTALWDTGYVGISPDYSDSVAGMVCHGDGWNISIACSTDRGENWAVYNTRVPGPRANEATKDILFSPAFATDDTLTVISVSGMSMSTDAGASFALFRTLHDTGNAIGVSIGGGATWNTVGPDNVIGNNNFGVSISDADTSYNVVMGNRIGVDDAGTAVVSNADQTVAIWGGHHNLIGGDAADERNIIANAASGAAVILNNSETAYNTVSGNYIGVDATGTAAFAGLENGVQISQGAHHNIIGGEAPAESNVIGGFGAGLGLWDAGTTNNVVIGNFIGTNAAGSPALGNRDWGVRLHGGASDNIIGGDTAAEGNVISGNGGGVGLWDSSTTNNRVSGNIIGADAQGLASIPNNGHGVTLEDAGSNTIGGPDPGEGNLIVSNRAAGVNISGSNANGNTVQGNRIGLGYAEVAQRFPVDQALSPDYGSDCTLFVATQTAGIFKSEDCGATWLEKNTGLANLRMMQVEIPPDAANALTVFALDENRHLYRSTDGGDNWALLSTDLEGIDLRTLVLSADFANDDTMYAAAQWWAWESLGNQPGVFKSEDGGATWARTAADPGDPHVWKLVATTDPDAAGVLFALTNSGIARSADNGDHWTDIPVPDPNWSDLGVSPNYSTDPIVALTANGSAVYFSDDGGDTWARTTADSPRGDPRFPAFAPDYSSTGGQFCHGGGWNDQVYCTTDDGASWTVSDTGLLGGLDSSRTAIAFAAGYATNGEMFMISTGGISRSQDRGATWALLGGLRQPGNNAGVAIGGGATDTQVLNNIISNNAVGVAVDDASSSANTFRGNRVGVDLTGAFAQANLEDGIRISSNGNTIDGNLVGGNLTDGIRLAGSGATGNVVSGNRIGTNLDGDAAIGNSGAGISIHSGATANVVGGDETSERNVISGNGYGIGLWDPDTANNIISGNYIGTDAGGTAALGNGRGINISGGSHHNVIGVIGGVAGGERNVISGNNGNGVRLCDPGVTGNQVIGNYVGLDATGTEALGNAGENVQICNEASGNTIGGDRAAGKGNVISAGSNNGVAIQDGAWGNTVAGNYIGLDAGGASVLGNRTAGIAVWNGSYENVIGGDTASEGNVIAANGGQGVLLQQDGTHDNSVTYNLIGLSATGAALGNGRSGVEISGGASANDIGPSNRIAYNWEDGVRVVDGGTLGNTISLNDIFANGGLGIRLIDGGNGELAAPRVRAYDLTAGTASGTACSQCRVEIFSTDDEEGRLYEGVAFSDIDGVWSYTKGGALFGPYITATNTDGDGNTSPFSPLFNLLVYDMGGASTFETLKNLGLAYDAVDGAGFATVDLDQYDVLFAGFTGNDPQPGDLLLPLVNRKDDIEGFVRAGGGLVVNSEDGVVETDYDWQWVPAAVTHETRGGNWVEFPIPVHLLLQGLTQQNLSEWPLYHNTFSAWTWPAAAELMHDPFSGDAVLLAGSLDAGRMIYSGADPDFHTTNWGQSTEQMLYNELYWAAGMLADAPPRVKWTSPGANEAAAPGAIIRVQFSEMLDASTIAADDVTVVGSVSGPHAGALTYLTESAQAIFVPVTAFEADEEVTVTVSGAVEDLTGNGLDGDRDGVSEGTPQDDATWRFTVRAGETCLVTTTADGESSGTLRRCLQDAQAGDTVRFDPNVFSPGSPATIAVQGGELPALQRGNVTVDASDAGVILEGSVLGNYETGLRLNSDGNTIYGLEIRNFPGDGIQLNGWGNTIGGPASGQGNILHDNGQTGIRLHSHSTQGNTVQGNIVGADRSGSATAINGENGVGVEGGASSNLIGGPDPGEGNVIVANRQDGVHLWGGRANTVQGNRIGLGYETIAQRFPVDQAVSPGYGSDCTLFVATQTAGIFKSTDCGLTWAEANSGLANLRMMQVEIPPDATDALTVFALDENRHLYKSTDGGDHWSLLSTYLEGIDLRTLVLSAWFTGDNIMWAAAQYWAWESLGGQPGVFISMNGGVSWERTASAPADPHVWKLVASPDPAAAGVLFALTDSGIARSADNGDSWADVPVPDGAWNDLGISTAYSSDSTIAVTAHGGRVYFSDDDGVAWDGVDALRGDPRFPAFAPDFATSGQFCHGGGWNDWAYCTTDGGATWSQAATGLVSGLDSSRTAIAFATGYATNGKMFMISAGGISRSQDRGATWELLGGLRQRGNGAGIWLGGAATENEILDNVVSNNAAGIQMEETGTGNNTIRGNRIGVDPTGAFAQANLEDGIRIGTDGNTIDGNLIGGNLTGGIRLSGSGATGNTVTGNLVGTNLAGDTAIGNGGAGISIHSGATDSVIGPNNIIANNNGGIQVDGGDTLRNTIMGNSIHTNANLGIDLSNGGNTELAAPLVAEVTLSTCRANGTACAGCTVEVFSDAADEGRWYEGMTTADVGGAWSFEKGSACHGPVVRATATDAEDNTSEFSPQPVAPAVSMDAEEEGVRLRWMQTEDGINRFEVYRSTTPYFTPDLTPDTGNWLQDVGPVGAGNEASYLDTTAYDEPLTDYYYIVLAVKDGEIKSPVLTRGGAFHFELEPGG